MKAIAIIGASTNHERMSNKAVRAYLSLGWIVYPVNPNCVEVEGLKCYESVLDAPEVSVISLYVKPSIGKGLVSDVIKKQPEEVFLNPGTEDEIIVKKLEAAGILVRQECSIRAQGLDPSDF